jgi:predicted alpha/beta-hydrolase family hydrolase
MHTPDLVAFADAVAARGLGAVRFNFPYAEEGRRTPDRQVVLEACYRAVAGSVAQAAEQLFVGGRSMGGRIASHIVAGGVPAAGLVLLSYPLHPVGQPQRLRDAHLYRITVPMLFLQGTRDAFAQPELLARTLARLPAATLHRIDGANHGLRVSGRSPDEIIAELADATLAWLTGLRATKRPG